MSVFLVFPPIPLCSHIVIIKSLEGPNWDPHLGLIAAMDVIRARMVPNQMVTKKIAVKKPNQAFLRLLQHMSGRLKWDLMCCEKNPFTTDILKVTTLRSPHCLWRRCTT